MNSKLICLVCILFTIVHSVYSQKYPYIGGFEETENGVTFFCTDNFVPITFFNDLEYSCFDGKYFLKSLIDLIRFENCDFTQIPRINFEMYNGLHRLDLSNIGLETIQPKDFKGATHLKCLSVKGNKFTEIPANCFHETFNLNTLDLSYNQINHIDPNAVHAENNLKSLYLSHNELSELPFKIFTNLKKLISLDLSYNKISEMPVNTIQKLVKLQFLNLAHNEITFLPSFLFQRMKSLREIDFTANQITQIDSFAFSGVLTLRKVSLAHNQLEYLDLLTFDVPSSVHFLDISFNQITVLNIEFLTKLVFLDTSSNPIEKMHNETFRYNAKLEILKLSHCGLSQIQPGTFSILKNLTTLDLSSNALNDFDKNKISVCPDLKILSDNNDQSSYTYLTKIYGFITTSLVLIAFPYRRIFEYFCDSKEEMCEPEINETSNYYHGQLFGATPIPVENVAVQTINTNKMQINDILTEKLVSMEKILFVIVEKVEKFEGVNFFDRQNHADVSSTVRKNKRDINVSVY